MTLFVFIVAERGSFAGGADGHEAIGALLDVPIDEFLEGGVIDLAIKETG